MTSRDDPPAPPAPPAQPHGTAPRQPAGASYSPSPSDSLAERLRAALAPQLLLVREIGAGGMARVFLAREPALKRLVAVKVLSAELAASNEARVRFEREAQAVAGLSHPNIVAVHGVGELSDGTPYFVMQHVAGRSMSARVAEEGPLSVVEVRRALGEVAAALATAHQQGIIHRDIKPANILYEDSTGRSLVSDFGIAAVASSTEKQSTKLTGTGVMIGTPHYMSPEQLLAEPVSEKTDIYSLGLLAHELLAGSTPFRGTSPNELIAAHLRDVPARLIKRRPDTDAELDDLVSRCLEKDASKRPTADEIVRRLTPGGVALLEWPPPGLDELHGKLRRLTSTYWWSGGFILAGIMPLVLASDMVGSALFSPLSLTLLLAALTGIALLLVAARRTVRIGGATARALKNGYAWMTVAETLADAKGDTGNIVTGSREYAALRPDQRVLFRKYRVVRELLLFAAGVSIVPMLLLVFVLGSSGNAGPDGIWLALAVPAILVLAAVVLDERERKAFAIQRKRSIAAAKMDVARLSGPWYESFEAVRRDQSLGRGGSSARNAGRIGAIAAAAALVLMVALLLPLVLVGTLGPSVWSSLLPKYANTRTKIVIASVVRPWALPKDPRITPLDAGRAYYALLVASGDTLRRSVLQERPRPDFGLFETPWDETVPEGLFPTARPQQWRGLPDNLKIMDAAARGFTAAEREDLRRIATAPHWKLFETMASARTIDYMGARWVVPFPDTLGWWEFPIPRFTGIKNYAYAGVVRAAYHFERGRRDSAEVALRQVVSVGFALIDNGNTLIEQLIGAVMVGIGRQGLIDLYRLNGDPRGARLRASTDSVVALFENRRDPLVSDVVEFDARDPAAARTALRRIAMEPREARGMRIEMLHLLAITPCTNTRELVFGIGEDIERTYDVMRKTWARFPSDSAVIQMIYRTPEVLERLTPDKSAVGALVSITRMGGSLLRNPRLAGCSSLLMQIGY